MDGGSGGIEEHLRVGRLVLLVIDCGAASRWTVYDYNSPPSLGLECVRP